MLLQQWPLFDFFLASWHRGCNLVAPGPTFRKYPQLPKLRPCYSCWGPGIDVPRLPLGLLWTKSGGMLHMMLPVRSWLGTYFGGFDRDFNLIFIPKKSGLTIFIGPTPEMFGIWHPICYLAGVFLECLVWIVFSTWDDGCSWTIIQVPISFQYIMKTKQR